uniref:Interferon-induced transmembrane protein 3 n=1 Tax=Maylandia zebra TaxID=106582 RepID=A0A3P9DL21_9CICH
MNPPDYPTEDVPLQGVNYGGLPIQPAVVQQTAVNINTDVPVIIEYPQDHIIWSSAALPTQILLPWTCSSHLFHQVIFKVYKMFSSFQARDRKVVGDVDGARRYGSTARCLNIISTIIVSTVFCALIIGITVLTTTIVSYRTPNLNSPREQYGFSY